jgi:hypothetical protein
MIMASRFTQACIVQSFFFSLGLMLKIFFFLLAFSPSILLTTLSCHYRSLNQMISFLWLVTYHK